ncbi:MAG: hypothetical protein HYZ27_08765 [Deltaproteobacteria bacterium]|nr:hypothetical protein [Deltaproteobacteria bacterium]
MRTLTWVAVYMLAACGGSQSGGPAQPAAVSPDAATFSAHGMSVERPDGWMFMQPDQSLAPDTAVVLQGPVGGDMVAPVVEIGRRPLTASQRRFADSALLSSMVMEISQTYDGFETVTGPENVQVAGKAASRLVVKLTESLPNGGEVERLGRIYGVVDGAQMWVIRCVGPRDGSADKQFDAIVESLRLGW